MVDVDTFRTLLSVMMDDFCKAHLPAAPHPGPQAVLRRRAVLPLARCGHWQAFGREWGFSRYAQRHLRLAFPRWPTRAQFNRPLRPQQSALVACFRPLVQRVAAQQCGDAALESAGGPPRDAQRRGPGWLPALADRGGSHRLG
jgi:hypothetical protein